MLTQATWRRYAVATLVGAGLMALYAAGSGILRGTVYTLVSLFSETEVDRARMDSGWVYLAYWTVFALLLFITFYIAALDMRFIRLRYLVEKRELVSGSAGNQERGESLQDPPDDPA